MSLPPDRRTERERDLYKGLLKLNSRTEMEPFLAEALRLVTEVVQAEQGYLELFEEHEPAGEHVWSTAAGYSDAEIGEIQTLVSRGIIAQAVGTGQIIVTPSAFLDPRFRDRQSVQRANIHAVLCAPIGSAPPLGVLYLQRRSVRDMFTDEDEACAQIFATHLAPLAHALFQRRRVDDTADPTRPFRSRMKLDGIVGASRALAGLFRELELVSGLDVCVLLTGDTGAGKNQVARAIHANSPRAAGPFVEINCAALPEALMESELFGALPGGHSTATRRMEGKVTAAREGTLFLDEIAELTTTSQAKLLQLLQTRQYYPLGAAQPVSADVRILAATNGDLSRAVAERTFREDLFYRLQVLPIRVPSLSERTEDIPLLARHFCEAAQALHRLRKLELSPGAVRALTQTEWPGNVRELSHRVEAATIRAAAQGAAQVEASHLGLEPRDDDDPAVPVTFHEGTRRYQRELLRSTLEATEWNVAETARRLDLTRSHTYNLIKALGLERR